MKFKESAGKTELRNSGVQKRLYVCVYAVEFLNGQMSIKNTSQSQTEKTF